MNSQIAAFLTIDGVATGAVYVLIALGFVLIFAVTRVIFVPFGDIAAFTALTLAALETGQLPGTVGLVAALAVIATLHGDRHAGASGATGGRFRAPCSSITWSCPWCPAAAVWLTAGTAAAAAAAASCWRSH